MDNKFEKLASLLEDEAVLAKVKGLPMEEAAAILKKDYNLDLTADELKEFGEDVKKALAAEESGELADEALENVSGGGILGWYIAYKVLKNKKARNAIIDFYHGFLDAF